MYGVSNQNSLVLTKTIVAFSEYEENIKPLLQDYHEASLHEPYDNQSHNVLVLSQNYDYLLCVYSGVHVQHSIYIIEKLHNNKKMSQTSICNVQEISVRQ